MKKVIPAKKYLNAGIKAALHSITPKGDQALAATVDVTKRKQVNNLIQEALKTFGKVDVLVNNAGVMPIAPLSALLVDEGRR